MKTVKERHEFFMNCKDGKELSLGDFMNTVPGFVVGKYKTGGENCNWTMAQDVPVVYAYIITTAARTTCPFTVSHFLIS